MSMQFKLSIHVAVAVIATAMLPACDGSLRRETPAAAKLEVVRDTDNGKDVGFTGLSFAGDGTLLAAGAMAAALWQIDTSAASARKIASYPSVARGCDPATLVRAGQDQTVIAASRPK